MPITKAGELVEHPDTAEYRAVRAQASSLRRRFGFLSTGPGTSLSLLNAGYLRVSQREVSDLQHAKALFFAAMRQHLIDCARKGAPFENEADIDEMAVQPDTVADNLEDAISHALAKLYADPDHGDDYRRIVHLRAEKDQTLAEIAEALGLGLRTIGRRMKFIASFLADELGT